MAGGWVAIVKCKMTFGVMVIGPSIGVNKWINKTGHKWYITEFTTNATNLIMHFCHIEKHLTVKHWFELDGWKVTANKFCYHFLTLMSFQMTLFCWTQKRFSRMLANHFAYPWFLLHGLECLKLCSTEEGNSYRFGMTWGWVNYDNFPFWVNLPLRTVLFVNNKHLIYIRHWYLSLIKPLLNYNFTSIKIHWI